MMDKIKVAAKRMGMSEDMMSDDMMMALGKTMMGASMMGKTMMEKGMDEKHIMEMMKKMADMMMDKSVMMEMKM